LGRPKRSSEIRKERGEEEVAWGGAGTKGWVWGATLGGNYEYERADNYTLGTEKH